MAKHIGSKNLAIAIWQPFLLRLASEIEEPLLVVVFGESPSEPTLVRNVRAGSVDALDYYSVLPRDFMAAL